MEVFSSTLRQDALAIFHAGITAADPYLAVKHSLHSDGVFLDMRLNDGNTRTRRWTKIHLLAFGKAACAMAKAALEKIPPHLLGNAIAVTNYENVMALDGIEVLGAGHPSPDAAGLLAAQKIATIAKHTQHGELVLVLVSGGGSALLPYPVKPVTLVDKIATNHELLVCGATINEINCIRKHLSQLKGGGLAKLAYPADVHALILSDVLGDDLSAIASGPTVPDHTTYADAVAILHSKRIWDKIPAAVQKHLTLGEIGKLPETPKAFDKIFHSTTQTLIGSNVISVRAMQKTAQELGYQTQLYDEHLCGEARIVAGQWVADAKAIRQPLALLAGGETTVSLQGTGSGGRNQEMALAFALAAQQQGLQGTWAFLSGGTDGRDGPTDAAGGLVDPGSINRMLKAGCEPIALLANNDSYTALNCSQDLLKIGATGTNVADLQILLIVPR